MRRNSGRPSKFCAVPWTKIDRTATSYSHEPDRSVGRGELADYEVRRELLRAGKDQGLGRLDALKGMLGYAPITTPVMLKAAAFWATARKMGRQSASDASLDADMILVAQAGAHSCKGCAKHDGNKYRAETKTVRTRAAHPMPARLPAQPI
jgi:hypothetical protein